MDVRIYPHLLLYQFLQDSAYIYLHHFNYHSKCSNWCSYSKKNPVIEGRIATDEELKSIICKIQNKDMFEIVENLLIPLLTIYIPVGLEPSICYPNQQYFGPIDTKVLPKIQDLLCYIPNCSQQYWMKQLWLTNI